jgi:hypothetical protein
MRRVSIGCGAFGSGFPTNGRIIGRTVNRADE